MISLLSTIVAPAFTDCTIRVQALHRDEFLVLLAAAEQNYCGHPLTWAVLAPHTTDLPAAERGKFWDGTGIAIAARPKGGVRNATVNGDTQVTLADLEFCMFEVEV